MNDPERPRWETIGDCPWAPKMLEVRPDAKPNPKSGAFSISSDICLRFFYINSLRKKKILIRLVDGRLLGGRASTNDRAELLPNFCHIFLISSIKANTAIFNTSYVQIFF